MRSNLNPDSEPTVADKRRASLERAVEVTVMRGQEKAEWRADVMLAHQRAVEYLLAPPWWLATASVSTVLCWIPRHGPANTRRALRAAGIPAYENPHLGGLTFEQAHTIANGLRARITRIEAEREAAA